MTGRRFASAAVLLALGTLSGCASWCARNYPCQAPAAAYAPAAPCCCAPAAVPACQPTSYSPTWQAPAGAACTPCAPPR